MEDLGLHQAEATAPDGTVLRFWVGGAAEGPRVLFLHGFPQNAGAWRHVAARLIGDFRLVIPDLRGYGDSDIPATDAYDLDTLVMDVVTIEGATRREGESPGRALLVAHDWGGPIAWHVIHTKPSTVRGLVATNAPHFIAYAAALKTREQAKRSWYTAVFQLPFVERLMSLGDGRGFRFAFESSAPPGLFSKEQLDAFVHPLLRPGRAKAALAYYRGAARYLRTHAGEVKRFGKTDVPAIIVWGQEDVALAPSHPDGCKRFVTNLEVRRLDGVSHWVPEQAPAEIETAVRDLDARTR
jgi:pimeloyl-ACP methyl ester carboxylesterase